MYHQVLKGLGFAIAASVLSFSGIGQAFELDPPNRLPGLSSVNAYLPPLIAPLRLELDLSARKVTLYRAGEAFKSYPVAVGRPGWETPTGTFKIETMYRNPTWVNPFTGEVIPGGDRDNPLGRRWMGFHKDGKNWAGFHGTNSVSSIGTAASHGCVRMFEKDIEELFQLVAVGTPLTVKR
ncbi:L,D-transpeptidase family protein [Altericista sp. CCNU0014]|uniref:L,D-transpeptidase family protein n=1 Tax=Altericista sp. CCNU0014 TaxID=3082949 RepID=UPI0038515885